MRRKIKVHMQESQNTENPNSNDLINAEQAFMNPAKLFVKLSENDLNELTRRRKDNECIERQYNRWNFEPEDYKVIGHREVTEGEKREANDLLKRACNGS